MKGTAHENIKAVRSLKPQAITVATVNGAAVDCKGFREALCVVETGALGGTSPSAAFSIEESDDSAFTTPVAVSGANKTITDTPDDDKLFVGRINLQNRKRFLRWKMVGTGTSPTGSLAASIMLASFNRPPVTQVETAIFDIT